MRRSLRRSHARYATPVTSARVPMRDRMVRHRLPLPPYPPVADLPRASAARGIMMALPVALALWLLVIWALARIL